MRISDWSSDVCSSDLAGGQGIAVELEWQIGRILEKRIVDFQSGPPGRRMGDDGMIDVEAAPFDAESRVEAGLAFLEESGHGLLLEQDGQRLIEEIGRESCRERVCQYV